MDQLTPAFRAENQPHHRDRLRAVLRVAFKKHGLDLFPNKWGDVLIDVVISERAALRDLVSDLVGASCDYVTCETDRHIIGQVAESLRLFVETEDGEVFVPKD